MASYKWIDDDFEEQVYIIAQCQIYYDLALLRHPEKEFLPSRSAVVLWPKADRILSEAIPESLRLEHHESRTCFRNGAYTAAVVMVRRTLEGVRPENGIKERTLVKSLQEMKASGLIDSRLFE